MYLFVIFLFLFTNIVNVVCLSFLAIFDQSYPFNMIYLLVLALVWQGCTFAAPLCVRNTALHRRRRQLVSVGLYQLFT